MVDYSRAYFCSGNALSSIDILEAIDIKKTRDKPTGYIPMDKRIFIASWLFLIGSMLFTVDAITEIADSLSLMSSLHLSESILFLAGSLFFMPDTRTEP